MEEIKTTQIALAPTKDPIRQDEIRFFPRLKAFLENKRSPQTRKEYERDIQAFGKYLSVRFPEVHHPKDLLRHHIIRYKYWLEGESYSSSTIHRRLASISSYFQFIAADEIISKDLMYGVDRPQLSNNKETGVFSDEQILELLRITKEASDRLSGLLYHALFSLAASTGLRSSSILNLKVGDIAKDGNQKVIRVTVKGGSKEVHPLLQKVEEALSLYMGSYAMAGKALDQDDFLFQAPPNKPQSKFKKPLTHDAYSDAVKKYARLIGISDNDVFRYSTHSFRGSFATALLKVGVPIDQVQRALGHKHISTTQKYDKRIHSIEDAPNFKLKVFK